jgi:outer membrane protein
VISQSETGKKVFDEMKKEEERLGGALEQKVHAFTTAKEEYDKKKDVMDEKGRSRKEKELTDMYTEMQKLRSESAAKFNEQKNTAMAPVVKKVNEIAKQIGRDDKYDFIFEKGVVYFSGNEKEDLTKKVIAELDKSSSR